MPMPILSNEMRTHLASLSIQQWAQATLIMDGPHDRLTHDARILALPTMLHGHDANLKLEWQTEGSNPSHYRIWVSRMTVEDGMPYDNMITIEHRYLDSRHNWGWRQWNHKPCSFSS